MAKQQDPASAQSHMTKSPSPWWKRLHVAAWLGVVVLVLFQALIANNQATIGQTLSELEQEERTLSSRVEELERQVAQASSLHRVRQQAVDEHGLQPLGDNVLYLPLEQEDDQE